MTEKKAKIAVLVIYPDAICVKEPLVLNEPFILNTYKIALITGEQKIYLSHAEFTKASAWRGAKKELKKKRKAIKTCTRITKHW